MRNYFFRIKSLLLFSLLLFAGAGIHAQVYPVQVTVVPTPPHRNYLNSFSEQGALNVFLTLTDFNSGPISVKLKMELNGPGYQFRSLPNNLVYVLNPGQPVQVPMEDLAVFFSSTGQSLNFNPAKLPEGNTSICVDVIKNQSGEVLSQNGCGYFYMGYGQPASLLQPACNSTVQIPAGYPASTDLSTLPLQFNFIPALAPIGLQQEVENTLYIYNWLGTVNTNPPVVPNGLALAMDPVELGPMTAYALLPINNQLIVGQEYVWYVKTSLNGSTNQFQNGGWSAPCKFKYGAAQSIEEALANGLSVEWVDLVSNSESKGTGTWKVVKEDPNSSATFNQFILKYRRKVPAGQQPFEWFSDTVNDLSKAIYQLEPATTYEASVAGRLGSFVSEPTEIRTFTTAPPRTYSCGVANFPGKATAFQPLEYADPGMKVKIGMFQLEFVSVQNTGQPGHFSGTGLIPVDFLFGAEARVKFDNLKIDKEYDVWEGTAHVITDGLDAWLEDQYQQFQDPIYVNGTVDSAYVSDSIAHVIIDGVDTTFTFPCATCPVIINDVAGNQVTIYPNGTVIWNSYLDVSDEQLNVPDTEIGVFEQHAQETGGFDPFEHIEWNANYEIIRTSNAVNYFVANKSAKKGQTDKVSLSVPENKYTETDVKLSWAGLTTPLAPASSSVSNGKRVFVFDLPAFNSTDEFAIYAVSDNLKIGKMNVVVYEPIAKNVVIVPLAGTIDAAQLTTELNQTLGEAGLNFTVEISDTVGVGKFAANSALNIPDATLMTKYSGKMRQIRNSYFNKHDLENDTYYLFVVAALTDSLTNQSVDGYMVRGKSTGFIHTGSSLQTYAHELGHGIGALEHSWKNNGPTQAETNNLMDYSIGANLLLSQWIQLRDPKSNVFWDEEEESEYTAYKLDYKCIPDVVSFSSNEVFLDLDGNKIKLGSDYAPYLFVGETAGLEGRIAAIRKRSTGELYLPKAKAGAQGYFHWTFGSITSSYAGIPYSGPNSATTLTSSGAHYVLNRNNQQTQIEYPFYKDCPGIPRSSKGGESSETFSSEVCGENVHLKYKHQLDSCMNITDVEDASEGLAFYLNKEEKCAINNLTMTQRAAYLDLLVQHDGSWIVGGKNVLLKLIQYIPLKDELALLNKFRDGNFAWLNSLTSHLDEFFDNDAPDREVLSQTFELMTTYINRNYASLNVPVSGSFTQTYYTPSVGLTITGGQVYSIDVPAAAFPIIVGANPSDELEMGPVPETLQGRAGMGLTFRMGTEHPLIPVLYENGSVLVTQQYKLVETPYGQQIMAPGTVIDDYVVYDLYSENYHIDPYEFVEVIFAQNYPELGFSEGQSIYVPAYYAFVLNNLVNATDFDRNLAEFVDKLEIAAAVITICTSPINPIGALTIFSGAVASVDLAIESKRFNGEMTQEEYDSDYYQTYKKAKLCIDVVTGLVNLPQVAIGLTKLTKSVILGSVRLGQKCIRNGKHVILAFAIRNSVRNAKLGNTLPNATALMREMAECIRTGKVFVTGAGKTLSEMRSSVDEWVRLQRQLATSNNQLREFNTATILYNKSTGKYYYGANKGIAVSGAEIHPTLASKLPETSTNAYKLGNCAECDAVNQALHDGANWGDLQMHTVGVQWNTGATFPKPLCSNCEITFTGIEIIQ